MAYHLGDPRERMVPSIIDWRLKQCDVNKDIEISDKMQFTLPDIQLKYVGRVFRTYVKVLGDRTVYRGEESLKVDLRFSDAFDSIRNPNTNLQKKIDELTDLVRLNSEADWGAQNLWMKLTLNTNRIINLHPPK